MSPPVNTQLVPPAMGMTVRSLDKQRLTSGLTVRDLARRYRVGADKVRSWIARGELAAINTAATLCGRPRWVVTADTLAEFERRRTGGPPAKPARRCKRREL